MLVSDDEKARQPEKNSEKLKGWTLEYIEITLAVRPADTSYNFLIYIWFNHNGFMLGQIYIYIYIYIYI